MDKKKSGKAPTGDGLNARIGAAVSAGDAALFAKVAKTKYGVNASVLMRWLVRDVNAGKYQPSHLVSDGNTQTS